MKISQMWFTAAAFRINKVRLDIDITDENPKSIY